MPDRATCENIGLRFRSEVGDAQAEADAIERMNEYLSAFTTTSDGKCECGRTLGGLLGSFEWGLVYGEGRCASCGWPARAYHEVDLGDVGKVQLDMILPYHESVVTRRD